MSRGGVRRFSPSRLQQARTRSKLSLEQLALVAGVEKSTIGHWETGLTQPSTENLLAVAQALKVQVADLVPIPAGDLRPADLRNRVGLTRVVAAASVGITHGTLGTFERGARRLGQDAVVRLAELYGVATEELTECWQRERDARIRLFRG